jgi:adenosine deaminase
VARIEEHPIARARELGLSFSVNTDDPGPFECRMASEYELLAEVFGFDERDFEQIYANSLAARFQPELRIDEV